MLLQHRAERVRQLCADAVSTVKAQADRRIADFHSMMIYNGCGLTVFYLLLN